MCVICSALGVFFYVFMDHHSVTKWIPSSATVSVSGTDMAKVCVIGNKVVIVRDENFSTSYTTYQGSLSRPFSSFFPRFPPISRIVHDLFSTISTYSHLSTCIAEESSPIQHVVVPTSPEHLPHLTLVSGQALPNGQANVQPTSSATDKKIEPAASVQMVSKPATESPDDAPRAALESVLKPETERQKHIQLLKNRFRHQDLTSISEVCVFCISWAVLSVFLLVSGHTMPLGCSALPFLIAVTVIIIGMIC